MEVALQIVMPLRVLCKKGVTHEISPYFKYSLLSPPHILLIQAIEITSHLFNSLHKIIAQPVQ